MVRTPLVCQLLLMMFFGLHGKLGFPDNIHFEEKFACSRGFQVFMKSGMAVMSQWNLLFKCLFSDIVQLPLGGIGISASIVYEALSHYHASWLSL